MKRSRIQPYSAKRRKRDAHYPAARRERAESVDYCCESCGLWVAGGYGQCHHREGRNVADPHRQDNLRWLCPACHERAHLEPLWAYATGISVRRNRAEGAA